MKVKIINATKAHIPIIKKFEKCLSEYDAKRYLAPLYLKKYKTFLLEVSGKIMGKVDLALPEKGHDVAYLRRLVIEPAVRRKGYGSELIQHCINYAKKNGAKFIDLHVHTNNIAAINLYKKLGFDVRHTEVHFRKEL